MYHIYGDLAFGSTKMAYIYLICIAVKKKKKNTATAQDHVRMMRAPPLCLIATSFPNECDQSPHRIFLHVVQSETEPLARSSPPRLCNSDSLPTGHNHSHTYRTPTENVVAAPLAHIPVLVFALVLLSLLLQFPLLLPLVLPAVHRPTHRPIAVTTTPMNMNKPRTVLLSVTGIFAVIIIVTSLYFVDSAPFRFLASRAVHDSDVIQTAELINETCAEATIYPPLLPAYAGMPPALVDYMAFHRRQRVCVDDPASCNNVVPPTIIWESELGKSGGFGDRMIAIRMMLMMSIITRRLFLIHWRKQGNANFAFTSAMLPAHVNWTINDDQVNEYVKRAEDQQKYSTIIRLFGHHLGGVRHPLNSSHEDPVNFRTFDMNQMISNYTIIRLEEAGLPEVIVSLLARNTQVDKKLTDGLSDLSLLQLVRVLSRFLFRPSKTVEFLVRRRTFSAEHPYIAVHARVGKDLLEEFDGRFVGLDKQYGMLSRRFIRCVQRIDRSQKLVFLASDARELKEIFVRLAPWYGLRVNTNKRIAWHVDRAANSKFVSLRDNCIAFLDVFADSIALSKARTVVYFQSNFPRISIELGNATTENWIVLDQRKPLSRDDCRPSTMHSNWDALDADYLKSMDV